MNNSLVCPRCHMPIAEERRKDSVIVCNCCGHVLSNSEFILEEETERTNLRLILTLSMAAIVIMTHLGSWGSYALEIRWLQFRDVTGLGSVASFDRMAEICKELKKNSCVEHAYARMSKIDSKQTIKLAEFQLQRQKYSEAAQSLKSYVSTKKDITAYLAYARALGESGNIDEATRYYEYVINARAKKAPVAAAQSYIRHLARAKRYDQAQNVILRLRRTYRSARLMDSELRVLTELRAGPEARGLASSQSSSATYRKR